MKTVFTDIWQLFDITRINDYPPPKTCISLLKKDPNKVQEIDTLKVDMNKLAALATNLWRAKKRMTDLRGQVAAEHKKIFRPIESAISSLEDLGVKIVDHAGETFDPGMAIRAVSFKPNKGISRPTICETLKPSIFIKDKLVQQGDVVVDEPIA